MRVSTLLLGLVVLSVPAPAQSEAALSENERTATVGMRARIDRLVLPGPLRVAKSVEPEDPIVLRVVEAWPHGTAFRYDLEYYGLATGRYDLGDYLVRKDGGTGGDLPPIEVEIESVLPEGVVVPNALEGKAPPALGGYRTLAVLAVVLWGVGLLAILFSFRRRRLQAAEEARPLTLADRLRPMVEAAQAGRLEAGGKAELERLLLAYWTRRLGLAGEKPARVFAELRRDRQAGALLAKLEEWLHRPQPAGEADIGALLEPYRNMAAEELPDPKNAVPETVSGENAAAGSAQR